MEALGKNVRVIDSPEDAKGNEYVVAMKTSTECFPNTQSADYHFAVLLKDGTWADKQGRAHSHQNLIDGTAPTWNWGIPKDGGNDYVLDYYNKESVYFAVEEACVE